MHVCNDDCKQNDKFGGLHFICQKCESNTLLFCAANEHKEVWIILETCKLIVSGENNVQKANVNTGTINAFDALFGSQSSLGFTCDQCRINQIIDNDEKTKFINEQKTKIDDLEILLTEKTNTIQQLTDENESPNNIGTFTVDDVTPASEALRAVSKTLLRDMRNLLSNEIEKLSNHV